MKTLKKIGFAVFAICMAFATMSCKDDDDDSPAVVTEWVSEDETITYYDDNTFSVKLDGLVAMTGTYSGDTTKSNVVIEIKVEKIMEAALDSNSESTKLVSFEKIGTGKISKDGKTMKVTITDLGVETYTKK